MSKSFPRHSAIVVSEDDGWLDTVVLMPEDLITLLVGNGVKSIVNVNLTPQNQTALQYNGASSQTRSDKLDFTCGVGKLQIYYGYETEKEPYDYGAFYLDDTLLVKFGSNNSAARKEVDVTAGVHTLKMTYTKDSGVNYGYDGFRIYAITYPRP